MYLLIIGFLLVLMKFLDFGPASDWSWWVVLSPFILIIIWWEVIEKIFKLREKREEAKLAREKKERLDRMLGRK